MLVNIVAYVRIFFFKAKQYFFVSIYATFVDSLIHEGQFGCFCLLAIVNCAAMNTGIQISIPDLTSIIIGIYPGMELLDHMELYFNFFEEPVRAE